MNYKITYKREDGSLGEYFIAERSQFDAEVAFLLRTQNPRESIVSVETFKWPKSKRITPEAGAVYTNRNGSEYRCEELTENGAIMVRLKDGWTLRAYGLCQYEDGSIEWDYSAGGHWPESRDKT